MFLENDLKIHVLLAPMTVALVVASVVAVASLNDFKIQLRTKKYGHFVFYPGSVVGLRISLKF